MGSSASGEIVDSDKVNSPSSGLKSNEEPNGFDPSCLEGVNNYPKYGGTRQRTLLLKCGTATSRIPRRWSL
jgi:hypothetical protein